MDCTSTRFTYRQTNNYTTIALDYIDRSEKLRPFFSFTPDLDGIREAMAARIKFPTDRELLVSQLLHQYKGFTPVQKISENIESLKSENTFTVTTAHQPNIFTGPLYFLYKILHAVKLAEYLTAAFPGNHYVPVYYMGSEDADLDELGNTWVDGQKISWATKQTGAVGRMEVDKELTKLISVMEGQLSAAPFGNEIISIIKNAYQPGDSMQNSIFRLVHELFGHYGVLVLIPDNGPLKNRMFEVFKEDLLHQRASAIVEKTSELLGQVYKVQASPREINLFYLKDNVRERIEKRDDRFEVINTTISFSTEELLEELAGHPERFSPNVILRGLYQETILPGIAFIGGGGELAYWLELKDLFNFYKTPFPVLLLRNSFLIVEKKWDEKINKLNFTIGNFFSTEEELMNTLVVRESKNDVRLNGALTEVAQLYETFRQQASAIDASLAPHVDALKTRSLQRLQELEKKMLRAEKRKFSDQQRQIHTIKEKLFPKNGLQERYENFSYYYAIWGRSFIDNLYQHSLALEEKFVVLTES